MDKKNISRLCIALCLGFASQAIGQLDLSPPISVDLTGIADNPIVVPLNLTSTGTISIDAFGLDFTYPTNLLTFVKTSTTGTLTQSWNIASGQENTPGEIIIGGFNTPAITTEGILINVEFKEVGGSGTGSLQLINFIDDLAGVASTNGTLNNSVPVELASFSFLVSKSSVKLVWTTASESNNFGFDIEKSLNGEVFAKIGFVQGNGTTVVPQHYAFTDNDFSQKLHYYRLKQIDTDGSFEYSATIKVALLSPETFALQQNYPNPFNPGTLISYQMPLSSRVTLVIYNIKGQVIRTLVNTEVAAGFHNVFWTGKDDFGREVASGVYVYRLNTHEFVDAKSLTLIR